MKNKAQNTRHFQALGSNDEESSMLDRLDELAAFEAFQLDIPKELKRALIDKMSAEDIYKNFENFAAIRAVAIVATEKDSGKALAAIKEILDRSKGKAVERKVVRHQMEELSDKELDAILISEAEILDEGD